MVVTGMMNNPGTKILEVGDLSQMLVVAQVDEADVGKLEVGQKAKVFIDAYPNHEFKGRSTRSRYRPICRGRGPSTTRPRSCSKATGGFIPA